jgi:hypothetical protein
MRLKAASQDRAISGPQKHKDCRLEVYRMIFELIDMRSFSNLWYWIALSVFWSTSSHWILGIPNDLIRRAKRDGGQTQIDLEQIARVNVARLLFIARTAGVWIVAAQFFITTALFVLAVGYAVEFAQAVLCLLVPGTVVGLLTLRTAAMIETAQLSGPDLHRRLNRHRMSIQGIGVVSIFFTAMFGMYQNMQIGVLGG